MSEKLPAFDPSWIREEDPPPTSASETKQKSLEEANDQLQLQHIESQRILLAANTERQVQDLQEVGDTGRRRKTVAKAIFGGTAAWMLAVLGVVLLQGFRLGGFVLGDGVLIALLTTTTATVIGITLVVMAWLYPRS